MNIEFSCANCGANLKVLKTFSGKTIQCPKCTKKTAVPAHPDAPPPKAASAKPAPAPAAAKPLGTDGVYISFACGNCGSALKVQKTFAGKSIQCPKCTKKTLVPGGNGEAAAPAAAVPPPAPGKAAESLSTQPKPAESAPAPVKASEPAKPTPVVSIDPLTAPAELSPISLNQGAPTRKPEAPKVAAPDPVPEARPPAATVDADAKVEALARQMRDLELRLEVARLKAEKAEQEKQALLVKKETDRAKLQDELSVHFQAEIEAARRTIVRLEEKVQEATQQRLAKASSIDGRTAAQIEKELLESPEDTLTEAETAVPNAVMADIRQSRFARYVRASLLIHVVVMALTSIGLIKGFFTDDPAAAGEEGATNEVAVAAAPAAPEAAPAADPATAPAKPEAAEPAAAKPPAARELEALPAPGEKPPTDTSVDLGL